MGQLSVSTSTWFSVDSGFVQVKCVPWLRLVCRYICNRLQWLGGQSRRLVILRRWVQVHVAPGSTLGSQQLPNLQCGFFRCDNPCKQRPCSSACRTAMFDLLLKCPQHLFCAKWAWCTVWFRHHKSNELLMNDDARSWRRGAMRNCVFVSVEAHTHYPKKRRMALLCLPTCGAWH